MSSQSVQTVAGWTFRHWTIDNRGCFAGSQRPAPTPPYSEEVDGGQFYRLASKLARVKSELARRVR